MIIRTIHQNKSFRANHSVVHCVAESESRESKIFTGSRSQKKDFEGIGSRSQSRKIYARLPTTSVAQKSD